MDTASVVTQSNTTPFDHQQVAKNKRKKFNPKYMLTNSSNDDDEGGGGGGMTKDGDDDRSSCDESQNDSSGQMAISNNNESPPPPQAPNPFLSPSKLSLLQSFNLQQQQLFQQAAISAMAPQISQQLGSSMNLSETEAKFREFAFKTMQELLNIYGLSLPPNEILEAMKNQQMSKFLNFIVSFSTRGEFVTVKHLKTFKNKEKSQKQRNNSEKLQKELKFFNEKPKKKQKSQEQNKNTASKSSFP